jgi:hypothetical protein
MPASCLLAAALVPSFPGMQHLPKWCHPLQQSGPSVPDLGPAVLLLLPDSCESSPLQGWGASQQWQGDELMGLQAMLASLHLRWQSGETQGVATLGFRVKD